MVAYHDREWGVPLHEDLLLFEFLVLEGFQAGLSWRTILRKRENFRRAFLGFDPERVARYGHRQLERLMRDDGIIRNEAKIEAAAQNARSFLEVRDEFGSFDRYVWRFTDGRPIRNAFRSTSQVPCETKESQALSKDLRSRGFRFVGPTICYAHMQATGMVKDHLVTCFRHREVARAS